MTPTLWAPYDDALKLILTGSTTGNMSSEQRTVFTTMLAQGLRDENGNSVVKRCLPDVNTTDYCIDEEQNIFELYYYIPDVVRLMIRVHGKNSLLSLPFDKNHLNHLAEGSSELFFGDASDYQDWLYTPDGQEYWNLILSLKQTLKKIDKFENTEISDSAKEVEMNESLLKKWKDEATQINNHLNTIETRLKNKSPTNPIEQTNFTPYLRAIKDLQTRLNATPEELAAWIFLGADEGGITAYLNANEFTLPPVFNYSPGNDSDFDYMRPLMACWFNVDDITNFQPTERFITGASLVQRWKDQPHIIPGAFIEAKIAESRLFDIHPITGNTQGSYPHDASLPPLGSALFMLTHIEKIEHEEFEKNSFLHSSDRDKALQHSANVLAEQWKNENRKGFSKRQISTTLATSDEWKDMTADRIERIIRIEW